MPRGESLLVLSARYSFHSFEMVISSGFRDSHRRLCITFTNLFDLTCFCSLLVDYFWHCYGTSNVSVGGCDEYPKSAILNPI